MRNFFLIIVILSFISIPYSFCRPTFLSIPHFFCAPPFLSVISFHPISLFSPPLPYKTCLGKLTMIGMQGFPFIWTLGGLFGSTKRKHKNLKWMSFDVDY